MLPPSPRRRVHSACSLEESFAPGSRPDRLLHRVVQYAAPAADDGPGGEPVLRGSPSHARGSQGARHHHSSTVGAGLLQPAEEREVACIHEQYGRPEAGGAPAQRAAGRAAAPAGLLERRFDLAAGRLQLVMQAGQGACGGPSPEPTRRTYSLDGELLEAGGPEAPCLPAQQVLEHAAMRAAAQAAQAAGRAAEEEAAGILAARQRQEQSCQLAVPHYYACRVKVGGRLGGPPACQACRRSAAGGRPAKEISHAHLPPAGGGQRR